MRRSSRRWFSLSRRRGRLQLSTRSNYHQRNYRPYYPSIRSHRSCWPSSRPRAAQSVLTIEDETQESLENRHEYCDGRSDEHREVDRGGPGHELRRLCPAGGESAGSCGRRPGGVCKPGNRKGDDGLRPGAYGPRGDEAGGRGGRVRAGRAGGCAGRRRDRIGLGSGSSQRGFDSAPPGQGRCSRCR